MMRAVRDLVAKIVLSIVGIAAVVRAATAPAPPLAKPITEAQAHGVYRELTTRERGMRRDAAVAFQGDLWSQDDDFHRREQDSLRDFASKKEVRLADVIAALDDGMRERWPTSGRPIATVPPCRPRLSY